MKKTEDVVIREETIELNLYAVRSKDGKWLRSKGYGGGGPNWIDSFDRAKIWTKAAPAKSQITTWARLYPQFGVPDLVLIKSGLVQYLDQTERTKESIRKIEIETLENKIVHLGHQGNSKAIKAAMTRAKKELKQLKNDKGR